MSATYPDDFNITLEDGSVLELELMMDAYVQRGATGSMMMPIAEVGYPPNHDKVRAFMKRTNRTRLDNA